MTDLQKLHRYLTALGLSSEISAHPCAVDLDKIPDVDFGSLKDVLPLEQIHVSGPKGEISVIKCGGSMDLFEIYCIEGELFDDICRYSTLTNCGRSIYTLLTGCI